MKPTTKRIIRVASVSAAALVIVFLAWPLPDALLESDSERSTTILDRHGDVLYEVRKPTLGLKNRIPLSQIPQTLLDAVIAVEDRDFYRHPGINPRGTLRAAWQNLTTGRVVSGGSGITQQLVRNLLGSKRRDVAYKLYEAYLALRLELKLSKDDILEEYLNTAYFGHQSYGIKSAATTFFGKTPSELSLAENAMLAGLPQSPSAYDPFKNFSAAKERQKRVLQAMVDAGIIDDARRTEALEEPITLSRGKTAIEAPHFVFWLLAKHPEIAAVGRPVRTTLDLGLQREVERIVEYNVDKLAEANVTSAAVVVLDAENGDILAMVGSRDYFDDAHDGAVNVAVAARQPGSALKPFVYALAMAQGDTPATTVADIETQFFTQQGNPYIPRNYDYGYHGLVRYREALANSYNIAAVKTLEKVGVLKLMDFLTDAGVTTLTQTPEHYGLALALGDAEVRLLELSEAYGIFPRGGRTLASRGLLGADTEAPKRILDDKVAWLIADILSDNDARLAEFGAASPLLLPFPSGAKTGTTRNSRDNWTVGFTTRRIVGVWVGNADNTPMRGTSGVTGAGPIYHDVMLAAMADLKPESFPRPAGIVEANVCRLSGMLPTPLCPSTVKERFVAGTVPDAKDDVYRLFRIDTRNGLLADSGCPQAVVEERVFAVFPAELRKWARENGWQQAPSEPSPLCNGSATSRDETWLDITRPGPGDSFKLDPLIPNEHEKVIFEARASDDVRTAQWTVDGTAVGVAKAPDFRFEWAPSAGQHVVGISAGGVAKTLRIEVLQ